MRIHVKRQTEPRFIEYDLHEYETGQLLAITWIEKSTGLKSTTLIHNRYNLVDNKTRLIFESTPHELV